MSDNRRSVHCEYARHTACSGAYRIGGVPVLCRCDCHKDTTTAERVTASATPARGRASAPAEAICYPNRPQVDGDSRAGCGLTHRTPPATVEGRRIFYRDQRFRVRATGQIGRLFSLRFAPDGELLTLVFDDEQPRPFLTMEVEEVLGA